MSIIVESAASRRARKRRKTLITLLVVALLVFLAYYYAKAVLDGPKSAATPTPTTSCSTATKPVTNTFSLNVLNSTKRAGLAASTARTAGQRGFKIGRVANDTANRTINEAGEVRFGPGGAAGAKLVTSVLLPGAKQVPDKRTDTTVDLVLGEGFNGLAPVSTAKPC